MKKVMTLSLAVILLVGTCVFIGLRTVKSDGYYDYGDDDDQRDDFLLRQEGLLLDGLAIAFGRSAGFLSHGDFIPFDTNDPCLL